MDNGELVNIENTQQIATHKKAMIEALKASLGIVTTASKKAEINPSTHYRWLKEDVEYRKAVDEIGYMALDFVKSKMFKEIENGNASLMMFYMKCKGKDDGWIERTEVDHMGNVTISFTQNLKDI